MEYNQIKMRTVQKRFHNEQIVSEKGHIFTATEL